MVLIRVSEGQDILFNFKVKLLLLFLDLQIAAFSIKCVVYCGGKWFLRAKIYCVIKHFQVSCSLEISLLRNLIRPAWTPSIHSSSVLWSERSWTLQQPWTFSRTRHCMKRSSRGVINSRWKSQNEMTPIIFINRHYWRQINFDIL